MDRRHLRRGVKTPHEVSSAVIPGDTTASGSSASFVAVDFRHPMQNSLKSVSAATAVHDGSMPAERWPLLCSAVSSNTSGSTSTIDAAHLETAAARPSFDANLQRILDNSSLDKIWSAAEPNPVRGNFPPFSAQRRLPARSLRGDPPGGPSGPLPIAPAPRLWGSASAHRLPTAGFLPVVPEALAAVASGSSPVHGLVSLPDRLHGLFASTDFPPSAQLPPSVHVAASRAAAHIAPLPAASLMLPPKEPRARGTDDMSAASTDARRESDSAATLAAPLATSPSAPLAAGFATAAGAGRHGGNGASRWRRRLEQHGEPVTTASGGAPFAAKAGTTWAFPSAERLIVAAQGAAGSGAEVAANASEGIPEAAADESLPRALDLAGGGMECAEGEGGLEGTGGGGGMEGVVESWGTWDTAWGVMGMDAGVSSGSSGLGMMDISTLMGLGAGAGMGTGMGTGMGVGTGMGTGMGMDIEAAVEMEIRCAEELLKRTAMVGHAEAPAIVSESGREGEALPAEAMVPVVEGEDPAGSMADPAPHPLAVAAAQAPPASGGDAPSPAASPEVVRLSRRNKSSAAHLPSSADAALMQAMELDRLEHDAAMARLTAMAAAHAVNRALPPAPPLASTLPSSTSPSTRLSAAPSSAARATDAIMAAVPASALPAAMPAAMPTAVPASMSAAVPDGEMDAQFLPALDFPSRPKRAKPLHPPVLPAAGAPSASQEAVSLAEAFRMEALRAGWGEEEGEGEGEGEGEEEMQESGGQGVEVRRGGEGGAEAGGECTMCGASSGQTSAQGGTGEGDGGAVDPALPGGSEGQAEGGGAAEERGREAAMEGGLAHEHSHAAVCVDGAHGAAAAARATARSAEEYPGSGGGGTGRQSVLEVRQQRAAAAAAAAAWGTPAGAAGGTPAGAAGGVAASGGDGKPVVVTAAAAACAGRAGGAIFDPWVPTRTTTFTAAHLPGSAPATHELLARRFAANQERSALPAVSPEVQQLFARRHTVSGTPSVRDFTLQPSLLHASPRLPLTLPTIHSLEDPLPLIPSSLASFHPNPAPPAPAAAPAAAATAAAAAGALSARTLFPAMSPFSSSTLAGHHVPFPPPTIPAPFLSPAIPSPAIPFRFLTPPLTPSSPPLCITPRGAISAGPAASSSSSGSAGAAGPFARSRGSRGSTGSKGSTDHLKGPFPPPLSAALHSEAARGGMLYAGSKRSLSSSTLPSITLPATIPFPPSNPIQPLQCQTFLPLSAPPPPFAATSSLLPFLPDATDPLRCLGCGVELDQENAREALALPDGVGPPLPPGSEMLAGRIPRVHGCNECLPLLVPSYFKRRAAAKKHTPNKSS